MDYQEEFIKNILDPLCDKSEDEIVLSYENIKEYHLSTTPNFRFNVDNYGYKGKKVIYDPKYKW